MAFAEPVHPIIPFTSTEHLTECSEYLDVEVLYNQALTCAEQITESNLGLDIPKCYVITTRSPDVYEAKDVNFISFFLLGLPMILGFYEDSNLTVYIVENKLKDLEGTYKHEIGHYIIHLVYGTLLLNGDPHHVHKFWTECSTPTFSSEE